MTAFYWALLTALIWGVVPLLEKLGLGSGSPQYGVMVRSLGVTLGMICLAWLWPPLTALRSMSWQSIVLLMGGGFLASFVGQMAFYHALRTGALSQVTPVAGAYPLVAALLGWFFLREPITVHRIIGVTLVIVGVWFLRK